MLSTDYLQRGITSLAHMGTVPLTLPNGSKMTGGGHNAAAMLAGYYLSRDNTIDPQLEATLTERVADAFTFDAWTHQPTDEFAPLFVPFPDEPAQPALLAIVEEGVERALDAVYAGANVHGVIYGALALRALRDAPEMLTPSVVRELRAAQDAWTTPMVQRLGRRSFQDLDDVTVEPSDTIPTYETERDMVVTTLRELSVLYPNLRETPQSLPWYHGALRKSHLVTFTHALCTLEALGYTRLAQRGVDAQRRLVKLARIAPPDPERHRIDESPYASILDPAYWATRKRDTSHSLKMPYAALSLLGRLSTAEQAAYEPFVCRLMTQY